METDQQIAHIYPALFYRNAPAAIRWLKYTFGFEEAMVVVGPNDTVTHAELRLGGGTIMLSSSRHAAGWKSPEDLPGLNQTLYVYVEDVDAHFERTKAAGARIVQELGDTSYGSREYAVLDIEGHFWNFGTYLPGTSTM